MDLEVLKFDIGLGKEGSSDGNGDDDANLELDVDEECAAMASQFLQLYAGLSIATPLVMLLWSCFSVVLTDPGSVSPNWRPALDEQRGEADPLNGSKFSGLQPDPSNQRI